MRICKENYESQGIISGFKYFFYILILLSSLLIPSCLRQSIINPDGSIGSRKNGTAAAKIDQISAYVKSVSSSMDNRLLVSQIIISGVDGRKTLPPQMKTLLKEIRPGGIMFFSYNLNTDNDSIRSYINEIVTLIKDETTDRKHNGIAPFISIDHEGGAINRFMPGVTRLPSASSYWKLYQEEGVDAALAKIESDSLKSAKEIRALGFNLNFAPVAEYTINENKNFLAARSYGPDPSFSALAAGAFIKGMEQADILCVIKHFPGVSGIDPHFHSSVLNMDLTSLKKLIYPFEFLINKGARALMTAHTLAPAVDKNKIASFSPVVMQNWLRDELGFKGIIISDDFNMKSIGNISIEEAAVQAVIAGTDIILIWPVHLKQTYNALLKALDNGQLTRERLLDAVERILYEKVKMGLLEIRN